MKITEFERDRMLGILCEANNYIADMGHNASASDRLVLEQIGQLIAQCREPESEFLHSQLRRVLALTKNRKHTWHGQQEYYDFAKHLRVRISEDRQLNKLAEAK